MNQFKEYDTVIALRDIDNVPVGSMGVVLISKEAAKSYIVEFVDGNSHTIDTIEVNQLDIGMYKENE